MKIALNIRWLCSTLFRWRKVRLGYKKKDSSLNINSKSTMKEKIR